MEKFDKSVRANSNTRNSHGDFDFFDLLRIFWKRRYIILLGTAVIFVIIAVLSFSTPTIYRSQTVVKPGLSHIDEKKRSWVHLDTPKEIKFLIETEMQFKVAKQISESKATQESFPMNFKILADKTSNTVTVLCDSSTPEDGIIRLQLLLDALKESYHQKLQPFLFKYESAIALAKKELMLNSKDQGFINANLNAILISLDKFNLQNNSAMENSESPQKMGQNLAEYTAIIERIAKLKQTQSTIDLRNASLNDEIKKIEIVKKNLKAIHVVQPPTTITVPSKRNKKMNLLAAPVIGFCLIVFLVFFFEYLRHLIPKIKQNKIFQSSD